MREVVPIRLSDQERGQIASAATRLGKNLSGFVREAALQASAVVERKASVKARSERAEVPERKSAGMVLIEPREIHHWVDDVCFRCGIDREDGGDLPCAP